MHHKPFCGRVPPAPGPSGPDWESITKGRGRENGWGRKIKGEGGKRKGRCEEMENKR